MTIRTAAGTGRDPAGERDRARRRPGRGLPAVQQPLPRPGAPAGSDRLRRLLRGRQPTRWAWRRRAVRCWGCCTRSGSAGRRSSTPVWPACSRNGRCSTRPRAPDSAWWGSDRSRSGWPTSASSSTSPGRRAGIRWCRCWPAGSAWRCDFQSNDLGGFKLGTPFAIQLGGGIRWVPGGRLQVRADVVDHLYQVRYPNSYFQAPATNVDPIRDPREKQNVWTNNAALTVGISWLYGR